MTRQPPGTLPSPVHGVLEQLRGVRSTGDGQWQACCPAHEDRNPSLSISIGDEGHVLLHCHVGCAFASVVNALRLEPRDLFAENGNGHRALHRKGNGNAKRKLPPPDRRAETQRYAAAMTAELAQELADDLGLPVGVLEDLDTGWCKTRSSWSFPEYDATGRVIGVLYRNREGRKVAGKGDKRGVTVPKSLATLPDPVLIVEGASDVLACLSMGLAAVGRPFNSGGADVLATLLRNRAVRVLGENDRKPDGAWPGRAGAVQVATELARLWGRPVTWAMPPGGSKDIRVWLADQDEVIDPGSQLLEALGASAETIEPPAGGPPPAPPRQSVDEIPPPPTDVASARSFVSTIFGTQETFRSAGVRLCRHLARFTDAGGFEQLSLTHSDLYGRRHRTLAYFANPWGVSVRRVQQMIAIGRLVEEMNEKNFVGLLPPDASEAHFKALLPLAADEQALTVACRRAVQISREEAKSKNSTRARTTARHVKAAVAEALLPAPAPKSAPGDDAVNLWKAQAVAWDLARITPGVPADVSAAIEEAHRVSRIWARTFTP